MTASAHACQDVSGHNSDSDGEDEAKKAGESEQSWYERLSELRRRRQERQWAQFQFTVHAAKLVQLNQVRAARAWLL